MQCLTTRYDSHVMLLRSYPHTPNSFFGIRELLQHYTGSCWQDNSANSRPLCTPRFYRNGMDLHAESIIVEKQLGSYPVARAIWALVIAARAWLVPVCSKPIHVLRCWSDALLSFPWKTTLRSRSVIPSFIISPPRAARPLQLSMRAELHHQRTLATWCWERQYTH
ncbi:hypothetical protein VFPPC_17601 [Pochonia chlamydosporia 170]|uniref:Uncharacterized protein n=1 Tax=Pochonia chlamydosporia 170 TaxID=1380566 RepID=A0A219AR48_METCM|nr:hypothetical protein VFPPC_17601 [Pochonia chlamydosporia 170]OWT43236.1 hypothetical protein VFPPC_17601 [Pochonia chlamydosporia 170]